MIVHRLRGQVVGSSNALTSVTLNNNSTTVIQNLTGYNFAWLRGRIVIDGTADQSFAFEAIVARNAAGALTVSPQFVGDTPPVGFSLSISGNNLQAVLPSIAGFSSASATFTLFGDATGVTLPLQIDSDKVNFLSPLGWVNYIINPSFDIWQRNTAGSAASSFFIADRWFNFIVGTVTRTCTRQTFPLGTTLDGQNPKFFMRTDITSTSGSNSATTLRQRIERVHSLAGQTATISFWAKANATKQLTVELQQSFGTGGSPSALVDSIGINKLTIDTTWQKYNVTVSIPSIAGKTLGTDSNDYLQLNFWLSAGSDFDARTDSLGLQTGVFDIAQVQVVQGSQPLPFERRPLAAEWDLCRRYWQQTYSEGVVAGSITDVGRVIAGCTTDENGFALCPRINFGTTMRRIPGVTVYNPFSGASSNMYIKRAAVPGGANIGIIGPLDSNIFGVNIASANTTVSFTAIVVFFHWTADAEI
jgi:hypothetical protein